MSSTTIDITTGDSPKKKEDDPAEVDLSALTRPAASTSSRRGSAKTESSPAGEVDLAELTRVLAAHFVDGGPRGYLPGLTRIREAICQCLRCSQERAEELVSQLRAMRLLRYPGAPGQRVDQRRLRWRFAVGAPAR